MLSLEMYDVDQVLPAVRDVKIALSNYPGLENNSELNVKMDKWVNLLTTKDATDSLTESEVKGLKLDMETCQ